MDFFFIPIQTISWHSINFDKPFYLSEVLLANGLISEIGYVIEQEALSLFWNSLLIKYIFQLCSAASYTDYRMSS